MKKKGFTLLELILTLSILSIIFTLIYSLFFLAIKTNKNIYTNVQMQNEMKSTLLYLENELKSSIYIEEILRDSENQSNFFIISDNRDGTFSAVYYLLNDKILYRCSKNIGNKSDNDFSFNNITKNKLSEKVETAQIILDNSTQCVNISIEYINDYENFLAETSVFVGDNKSKIR